MLVGPRRLLSTVTDASIPIIYKYIYVVCVDRAVYISLKPYNPYKAPIKRYFKKSKRDLPDRRPARLAAYTFWSLLLLLLMLLLGAVALAVAVAFAVAV